MEGSPPRRRRLAAAISAGFAVAFVAPAATWAEDQPTPVPPALAQARPSPDFFFGQPRGSIAFRGAWLFASAGSDIFDFVTEQLTIDRRAFDAPALGAELAIRVRPRVDIVVGIDASFTSTSSEYRDFVDNNFLPIAQQTSLRQVDLSASVRVFLRPRGQRISRFAWIPSTFAPYVGAGGGMLKYDLKQSGDFVDFADLSVFTSRFQSEKWTPSAHVFGGAEIRVFRKLYATTEARYVWASADLDTPFVGFDPIDLSGLRCGAGLKLAF